MANEKNPYEDVVGLTGYIMGNFPETTMDIEDAIGFGKIYESEMERRGKKSTKDIDEDYAGRKPKKKKVPLIKPDPKRKKIRVRRDKSTKTERGSEFLNRETGGDLSPKQQKIAKLAGNPDKIDAADFTVLRKKKYGGKINYRMTGGQVVDASYD